MRHSFSARLDAGRLELRRGPVSTESPGAPLQTAAEPPGPHGGPRRADVDAEGIADAVYALLKAELRLDHARGASARREV
jgi:hypothetical protein